MDSSTDSAEVAFDQKKPEPYQETHFIQHAIGAPSCTSVSKLSGELIALTIEDNPSEQQIASLMSEVKESEAYAQLLEAELRQTENFISNLELHLCELDKKQGDLFNGIQQLNARLDETNCRDIAQELIRMLKLLKDLKSQESNHRSISEQNCAEMQAEIMELEKKISGNSEKKFDSIEFDNSVSAFSEKLSSAKRELAAKLRAILSLKRQIDNVPAQSELIQYERRFSELYVQIQEKHRQTRKYYATYNAFLEIKELMLKEISLLNSIDSQFQDAMTSITGRMKLVDSMEVILKGTRQKLEKVQSCLLTEEKIQDSLKEKHAAAIAEQRRFSSLLKAFQEECARNERLRCVTSK